MLAGVLNPKPQALKLKDSEHMYFGPYIYIVSLRTSRLTKG